MSDTIVSNPSIYVFWCLFLGNPMHFILHPAVLSFSHPTFLSNILTVSSYFTVGLPCTPTAYILLIHTCINISSLPCHSLPWSGDDHTTSESIVWLPPPLHDAFLKRHAKPLICIFILLSFHSVHTPNSSHIIPLYTKRSRKDAWGLILGKEKIDDDLRCKMPG